MTRACSAALFVRGQRRRLIISSHVTTLWPSMATVVSRTADLSHAGVVDGEKHHRLVICEIAACILTSTLCLRVLQAEGWITTTTFA